MRNSILSFLLVVIEIAFGQHYFYCSIFSGKLQPVFLNGCAGQFFPAEKSPLSVDMSDINRVRYHPGTYPLSLRDIPDFFEYLPQQKRKSTP